MVPKLRGKRGASLVKKLMHLASVDKVNDLYDRHCQCQGADFAGALLRDIGVDFLIGNPQRLEALPEGPFITVSNHPYGGLDGLILIDLIGHFRDDYKVMANQFLNLVKTIKDNFISVVPNTNDVAKVAKESVAGVRKALMRIKEGHPLGLFPAGAVSDFHFLDFRVYDREWQESAIRLIQKMKVPVLPIRFFDRNSNYFYFLGLVSWKIRTLRLPKEILNKSGKRVRIGIGPPISVEAQEAGIRCGNYAEMLRNAVYDMTLDENLMQRNTINFEFLNQGIS